MKDIQEEIYKIEKYNLQILTTKELNGLGVSNYFIQKLVEEGNIEKISRGEYKVTLNTNISEKEEKQKANLAFNRFSLLIMEKQYNEAYNALMENVRHQINHNYDNHLRIYFSLLKIILGDTYDFSILDELYEFTEEKTESYYDNFILFRENVMSKNYYDAKFYLKEFRRVEKEKQGYNNVSTKLFSNLINEVVAKLEKEKKEAQNLEKNSSEKAYTAYQSFLFFYKKSNYKLALEYITICCTKNARDAKTAINNKRLLKLLKQLIKMEEEKIGFEQKEIDYSKCHTSSAILNQAIDTEDFQTAFKNIGKVTYQSHSQVLDLFKDMLHKMYYLDKEYQKKKNHEETLALDSKSTNDLTYDKLYDLVNKRQYKELYDILIKKNELSRLEYFTLRMLKLFFEVKYNGEKHQEYSYRNAESDSLKRMYEAIQHGDIREIKSTIANNKTFIKDTKEIDIYEIIMKDIIQECQTKQIETENQINRMAIDKKIANIVYNKEILNPEEIDELYKLIQERMDIEPEEILYIFSEILNTITDAINSNIDSSYFETLENSSEDINTKFLYLLRNGDYLSALKILKKLNFHSFMKEVRFEDKLLLKRLLYILKNVTNKTSNVKKALVETPTMEDGSSGLKELKIKIKKRDFYGAFKYALQLNLKDQFLKDIIAELLVLYIEDIKTEKEIYHSYLESIENNNQKQAIISLNDYDDLLKNTSMKSSFLYQNRFEEMKRMLKK